MQSIITKYIGPRNVRGARIKATSTSGFSTTVSYPHELDTDDAHAFAALALARKLKWTGTLLQGGLKDGFVFVFAESPRHKI